MTIPATTTPVAKSLSHAALTPTLRGLLAKSVTTHTTSLLVGTPIFSGHPHSRIACTTDLSCEVGVQSASCRRRQGGYITSAQQAMDEASKFSSSLRDSSIQRSITAVLHGEEQRELFAVPTCEHGHPWPVCIWIDASTRTVRLVKSPRNERSASCHPRTISPKSVVAPATQGLKARVSSVDDLMAQTKTALALAIRTPPTTSASATTRISSLAAGRSTVDRTQNSHISALTRKERIVQAVMLQWKVVTMP
jgi:hypothetical protein